MPKIPFTPPICPTCHELLDGFSAVSEPGSTPAPGSLTVCAYCITPLEFDADLKLQVLDMDKLPTDVLFEVRRAMLIAQQFRKAQKARKN